MRRAGSASPEATSAARTRSRASRHRLVGEADDVEGRQAGRDLHLDIDGTRLDALERHCRDPLDHAAPAAGQRSGSRGRQQEHFVNKVAAPARGVGPGVATAR